MKKLLFLAMFTLALPAAAAWPEHFTIYGIGAKSAPNKHGQADLQSLNFEASGPARHGIDVGVVFAPTLMSQPTTFFDDFHESENVRAASLSLLARHTFARRGAVQPYVELSSGPIYASRRVPESTSHFNFISQAGVGVVTTSTRVPLMLGIRFFHISNAGYAERNPGINFTSILLGLRLH
jgi:hypothetical protein